MINTCSKSRTSMAGTWAGVGVCKTQAGAWALDCECANSRCTCVQTTCSGMRLHGCWPLKSQIRINPATPATARPSLITSMADLAGLVRLVWKSRSVPEAPLLILIVKTHPTRLRRQRDCLKCIGVTVRWRSPAMKQNRVRLAPCSSGSQGPVFRRFRS